MRINSLTSTNKFQSRSNPVNFKQGLTRDIVNHVKNMPSDEYIRITERLQNQYGMRADVGGSNVVAFCVEQTAEIMKRAGFMIPKLFSFEPIKGKYLGESSNIVDKITINSRYSEFLYLEQLNEMEEQNDSYNGSKYFLDTYLHEFLHAAHRKNIIKIHGNNKGNDIYDKLENYAPYYNIRQQLLKFTKNLFPKMTDEESTEIFPETIRLHETEDLAEYFVEKNARKIEIQLGDKFNIDNIQQNMAQNYKGFPENWNINDEVKKMVESSNFKRIVFGLLNPVEQYARVQNTLDGILSNFEGEIWNGDIKEIKKKSHAFRDYGKIHPAKRL